ncbi:MULTISPECIES: GNAT family N-acetyltransferase [Priestia]|uniref:GNAT family N-acetyltransferase n=1 Tax=Priestia TaxID=2800373 RepID=UPI001C8D4E5C|nr:MULTISPECIES: GNAT family N-acetyltransferase [Priestia]MBX9996335.1 GNAT family N-acetyltransferase [Priestia aryabhattai]MCP1447948.1 putative GNAT family acetyltransferase [Priestia megaterium]
MIQLHRYSEVQEFKNLVESLLAKNEVLHNLALGILHSLHENSKPNFMGVILKDSRAALVLLQTHPRQIILSQIQQLTEDELSAAAELLQEIDIPGLVGERQTVLYLSQKLADLKNQEASLKMDQRIYRLDKVKKAADADGVLVKARLEHLPLVTEWIWEFMGVIGEPVSKEQAAKTGEAFIKAGRLFLWEVNGKYVSIANATRPTAHNITINYVYTPLEERKKGYASSCVSTLSQLMLDEGFQTTSLYTDMTNPTSNKIYMEIGYEHVADSALVLFHEKK